MMAAGSDNARAVHAAVKSAVITKPVDPTDGCKCKADITVDNIYMVAPRLVVKFADKYLPLFIKHHQTRLPGERS
jgi:hypothetical protein